jgi:hypothetical protein
VVKIKPSICIEILNGEPAMNYPGRIVKLNEADATVVRAIADRLRALGYTVTSPAGRFDSALKSVVRLFQSQHVDALARPLAADGEVGPMTWAALFGAPAPTTGAASLAAAALAVAIAEIGTMEDPVGSNRGRRVEEYLASTGLGGGFFWCMAFVHFCFMTAAKQRGVPNPFPRTAGCIDAWNRASAFRITRQAALQSPDRVVPGAVFIFDYGNGAGHTGFVRSSVGGALRTVEGNSNPDGSRNGIGVFEINRRNIANAGLRGFIVIP